MMNKYVCRYGALSCFSKIKSGVPQLLHVKYVRVFSGACSGSGEHRDLSLHVKGSYSGDAVAEQERRVCMHTVSLEFSVHSVSAKAVS